MLRIKRNKANMTMIAGIWISPGVNDIPDEKAVVLKGSKQYKHECFCGLIEVVQDDSLIAVSSKNDSLKPGLNMNAKKAVELIRETFDRDLLESWTKNETRKTVLNAIDAQIDEINTTDAVNDNIPPLGGDNDVKESDEKSESNEMDINSGDEKSEEEKDNDGTSSSDSDDESESNETDTNSDDEKSNPPGGDNN